MYARSRGQYFLLAIDPSSSVFAISALPSLSVTVSSSHQKNRTKKVHCHRIDS